MTHLSLIIAIAAATIAPAVFAEEPSTKPSVPASSTDAPQADEANRDITNRADEKFLKNFAQVNAAKVDTGKLAEWKAEDPIVKAFATQMVDAHSKTIAKIVNVATETSIDAKAKPDFIQKTKSAFLDVSVGGSFDRAYLGGMIDDAEEIVEMLEKEINDGQNPSIKQLAADSLTDVQRYLKVAADIRAQVAVNQIAARNANRALMRKDLGGAEKVAASQK